MIHCISPYLVVYGGFILEHALFGYHKHEQPLTISSGGYSTVSSRVYVSATPYPSDIIAGSLCSIDVITVVNIVIDVTGMIYVIISTTTIFVDVSFAGISNITVISSINAPRDDPVPDVSSITIIISEVVVSTGVILDSICTAMSNGTSNIVNIHYATFLQMKVRISVTTPRRFYYRIVSY